MAEITIEIDDGNNGSIADFPPTSTEVRGAWRSENVRPRRQIMNRFAPLLSMESAPGMRITVDVARKMGRISDPLNKNKPLLERINHVYYEVFRSKLTPVNDIVVHNLDERKIRNWLFWMKRFVLSDKAKVVSGEWPEIKGEIDTNRHDRTQLGRKVAKAEDVLSSYAAADEQLSYTPAEM